MSAFFNLYTDGSCLGNPGPGGWGVFITDAQSSVFYEGSGYEDNTTNNRMEMLAVIKGLQAIPKESSVVVYTDSQYVQKGMESWLSGWKARNWKTASGSPVKNQDLWKEIDALSQSYNLQWQWVKGHAGHPGNEKADALAHQAAVSKKGNAS